MPNQYLVELAGLHGFDFVVIDCEHGTSEISLLASHIHIARAFGLSVVVRIPGGEKEAIGRILDAGADGLLIPHIRDSSDAEAVVAAAFYPPAGHRGFAAYTPAGSYGLKEPVDLISNRPVIIAMIEEEDGVESAGAIASVPGITGLMVGPADLAVSFGLPGETQHPDVVGATARVHESTRRAGKTVTVITGLPQASSAAFDQGAGIVIFSLSVALNAAFQGLVSSRPSRSVTAQVFHLASDEPEPRSKAPSGRGVTAPQ
ncbi:HpcH/HpaI aldolase family protein [Pseudarthrobacter sp. YAF2]|uniref:HpcH/HpaI aldolase family protein n=1 Tax=Pseudarthrobacter sp. YAF2 TaxID=3233078 RepID=UPI003F9B6232